MTAVADASPLILFARTHRLDLLQRLFRELWVPPRVVREVCGDLSRPGALLVASAVGEWIHEQVPTSHDDVRLLAGALGEGEAEAIVLASELRLLLLIDDLAGRAAAKARGLPVLGSVGVAGLAKRHGLMPAIRPFLEELMAEGLRLSRSLYLEILVEAGEAAT